MRPRPHCAASAPPKPASLPRQLLEEFEPMLRRHFPSGRSVPYPEDLLRSWLGMTSRARDEVAKPTNRTGQSDYRVDTRPKYWKAADGFPFIVVTDRKSVLSG